MSETLHHWNFNIKMKMCAQLSNLHIEVVRSKQFSTNWGKGE